MLANFTKSMSKSRSLAADRRKKAKTKVKAGQGDKGDQVRQTKKRKKR